MPGLTDYYVAASLGTPAETVRLLRDAFAKIKDSPLIDRLADKYGVEVR